MPFDANPARTIDDLIDILRGIDNGPESATGFDMMYSAPNAGYSKHPCGSACCIGGHATLVLRKPRLDLEEAVEAFGVPPDLSHDLCYPSGNGLSAGYSASPAQAIRCLQIVRDEGVVDWKRACVEVPA